MRNLRLAFRTLFKSPFVTIVAILSLALGVGANAAIYSLFNEILQKPLPVLDAERLVNLAGPGPIIGINNSCDQAGSCGEVFSYPMFRDLEKANSGFAGIAAHRLQDANVSMPGQTPLSGLMLLVSGSYFPVLGVKPAIGRLFTRDDDAVIGGDYQAVLDHAFWETEFGSNPDILGQKLTVNGQRFTIIGVTPRGFSGTTLGARPLVFLPITMRGVVTAGGFDFKRRDDYWIYLFARLKPGVSIDQAKRSINSTYVAIINDVEAPLLAGASAQTLARFRAKTILLDDGRRGQSAMIKTSETPLILLFSITGIVLLIACANIANLLLARAANRSMEMAVRLSIGATRGQLIAQLLTESVVLAIMSGVAGIAVAVATLRGIVSMLPREAIEGIDLSVSGAALLFMAVVSVATGFLFGLGPALHGTRPDLVTALRNNSGKLSASRAAARLRSSLVTAQIALSMALLISAGLFIKSLHNISRVELGINIDNVVTFGISPALSGYDSTRTKAMFERVEDALRATPGVTGVTTATVPVLVGNWGSAVSVEGFQKDPDTDAHSRYNLVGPGYFTVFRDPLIAGRDFTASDDAGGPRVAIVNETFARKFNLGRNAVGKRMSVNNDSLNIEIIGLAKDSKYYQVKGTTPPVYVLPYRQRGGLTSNNFYVRSPLPAEQVMRSIRDVMRGIDPNLPVEDLKTLPQQVRETVFLDRLISTMSVAFAALATLLAAIGLYGMLAYSVAHRTREIGVRMALGADDARVRRMVLRQVGTMTSIGGVIGIIGAIALGKSAQSLLFELNGTDPIVFTIAALCLLTVAFAAGFVPALRASRIDPMSALRHE